MALLTASLLRIGSDTKGPRLFAEHIRAGLSSWADAAGAPRALALALSRDPTEAAGLAARARKDAQRAQAETTQRGFDLVTVRDDDYPEALGHLPDPPIVIWTHGLRSVLSRPAVAIVGSRQATPAGLEVARRLGQGLAAAGVVVVSGLARGIDAAAHRGALQGGGPTMAVLGSGLDRVYPPEHRGLAAEVRVSGCLISELPPGTPPLPRHFPLRNRIISGLSRAVVVVEASDKSGSLITARMALEQGRDVLAVPGNVVSGCHRGCHALIKDGARLVENVEDILDEVGWTSRAVPDVGASGNPSHTSELLALIRPGETVTVEDLAARSGRQAALILAELGRLELDERVGRSGVGTYVRLD
jgi:DNA processing protein